MINQELRRKRQNMHTRCNNPNADNYDNYGGRGITLCPEWTGSSTEFIAWAIDNGWKPGLQIERIDNDDGYSPNNCKFVTNAENQMNTRLRKDNTSGHRGIYPSENREKFRVILRNKHIGMFNTYKEAKEAYECQAI